MKLNRTYGKWTLTVLSNLSRSQSSVEYYQKSCCGTNPWEIEILFRFTAGFVEQWRQQTSISSRGGREITHNVVKFVSWLNISLMFESWLWPRFLQQREDYNLVKSHQSARAKQHGQNSEGHVQILKCNHLGDGVRYSPSEVIAGKISACQRCISDLKLFST